MLQVTGLRKSFGARDLFNGVTFHIGPRDRVGLVAPNGAGKTTLLRLLAGQGAADSGTVALQQGVITGYLSQESGGTPGNTVRRELLSGLGDLLAVQGELDAVSAQLDTLPPHDPRLSELVALQGLLQHRFEDLRGYDTETELGRVLRGLGFHPAEADRAVETFSGGWQMRIALGRLLLQRPDLLLLDEPTNHLDMAAVEWLEDCLTGYPGALLMVSHDRRILDTVTTRTLELAGGALQEYATGYSAYVVEKVRRAAQQAEAFARQQRYLAETQAWIDRFHAKATKASQTRSRQRALEKLEMVEAPEAAERPMALRFDTAGRGGRTVLELSGVTRRFGDLTVLDSIDLTIERGERLALVGPNGAGKSTLMRLLAGVDQPDAGLVRRGENALPVYFAQHQAESLDPEKTVLEEVAAGSRMGEGELRSLLGRFLFTGDDAFKLVAVLSGGERSRLAFAKMLRRASNLLLLDEPTNHLDIQSQEALEAALLEYPGAIVLASHDRYLIDRLATKIVVVERGGIQVYLGNYTQYLARLQQREAAPAPAPASVTPPEKPPASPARQRAEAAAARRRLAEVEAEIAALEAEQAALTERLNQSDLYADHRQAQAAVHRHQAVGERLEALLVDWEAAAAAVG